MKTKLSLFAVCLLAVSCNDNDVDLINYYQMVDKNPNVKDPIVVTLDGAQTRGQSNNNYKAQALKFKDYTHYQQWVYKLEDMTPEQRDSVNRKLGFVSLDSLLTIADAELDSIGDAATTESEFRESYKKYVEKYHNPFVFNTTNPEDLSAYIPTSENESVDKYIYGYQLKVVVKGEVVNSPFRDDMNSTDKLIYGMSTEESSSLAKSRFRLPDENTWPVNSMIKIVGHKKTIFNVRLNGNDVFFHLGAQKKMWYGWKRDNSREFYFSMENVSGMGAPVYKTGDLLPSHFVANLDIHVDYYHFWGMKNGDRDFKMGTKIPLPLVMTADHEPIIGNVFIWTDMTIDHDENGNVIYVPMGPFVSNSPSMTKDKSYPCKISL